MKKQMFLLAALLMSLSCLAQGSPVKWKLDWQNNFKGDSIDYSVWSKIGPQNVPWGKYMSFNDRCFSFRKGNLVLWGLVNPNPTGGDDRYITGGLSTHGKKTFTPPCRIEVRAKIKGSRGAWPAIWMLPEKRIRGEYHEGEIDIMEHLNYDKFVYQTAHNDWTGDKNHLTDPLRSVESKIKNNKFNVYAVDILENELRYYVNGKCMLVYPRVPELEKENQFPYFDRDWYLMIDMQLGGGWVGEIVDNTLPSWMELSWVKYYRPAE